MTFYKFDKLVKEATDLFDKVNKKEYRESILRNLFKDQDKMAEKSEVFKRILQSEISDDPETRYNQTNSPTSKTRSALTTRQVYNTQEEWEKSLLTNPFYELEGSTQN